MKIVLVSLIFLFLPFFSTASNFVGGGISIQCIGTNTYQFNISCCSQGQVWPTDSVSVDCGDGSPLVSLNTPNSSTQFSNSGYFQNNWNVIHAYAGASPPGGFSIVVHFMNRVAGIANIPNSQNGRAFLYANFIVNPLIGNNSSPILTDSNFMNQISVNQNYFNNLGPMDVDGDSLSFSFDVCYDNGGVVSGYLLPEVLGGGVLHIDSITGNYYWNNPQISGAYNVVIRIEEWRHFSNGAFLIGYVSREIQFNTQQTIGITELESSKFFIYPNPAMSSEKITIQPFSFIGNYHARIYNSFGQVVWESPEQVNGVTLIPILPNGIYFMEIGNENTWYLTEKLIIQD